MDTSRFPSLAGLIAVSLLALLPVARAEDPDPPGLERPAIAGDSPVGERRGDSMLVPEYHEARGTLWESGRTIFQG